MNTFSASVISGSYAANDLAFVAGCAGLAVLVFGVMLFSRSEQKDTSRAYLVMTIAIAGWLGADAFMYASVDHATALAWARRAHLMVMFVPAAMLHFAVKYVGKRHTHRWVLYGAWALSAIAGLSAIVSPAILPEVRRFSWGFFPAATTASLTQTVMAGAFVLYAIFLLARARERTSGAQRKRATTVLIGYIVGLFGLLDLLPLSGVEAYPLGFVGAITSIVIASSVVWGRAVDLDPEYAAGHVLDTMKSAVVVIDMYGHIRVVNRATTSMLGFSEQELIGAHLRKIVEPDAKMSTAQLLNSMGVFEQNMAWLTSSGSRIDVLAASSYIRDAKGTPVGVVYVASDYTERKRAGEALRESEQRYRTLFDANPLPMWVYDFDTLRFTAVNHAAIAHYGYSRDEFLAMKITDIRPPEDAAALLAAMPEAGETREARLYRHTLKDGTIIDAEVTSFEFLASGRRARLVISRDVTDQRKTEQRIAESEERYRTLVEMSPDAILIIARGEILFANNAAARLLGADSPDSLLGRRAVEFVRQSDQDALAARLHVAENGIPLTTIEQTFVRLDGRTIEAELAGSGFSFRGRSSVQVVARDLSERKATEARFQLLFERNLAGVYRSTIDGRILECNESCARIFGYQTPAEMIHDSPVDLFDDPADRAEIVARLREEGSIANVEVRMRRRDGSTVWVLENAALLRDEAEYEEVMEGTIIDITERKLALEQIEYQAYHDVLTGLPNRQLFRDRISVALAHAKRKKRGAAVMFLDLDQFKHVNDTLGHSVGDRLLQAAAARLVSCVRAEDTVARMGGDEFTILLPDLAEREGAARVAQKVLDSIRHPMSIDGNDLYVSTSIGIATYPENGDDAEELLKNADSAMYRAKEAGRDTFRFV